MSNQFNRKSFVQPAKNWELESVSAFKSGRADAKLLSKDLDPYLHPKGYARVQVAGEKAEKEPGYILDAFVLKSIEAYVEMQEKLRHAIEMALFDEQVAFGVGEPRKGTDVWKDSEIDVISFDPKNVSTAAALGNLKLMMPKLNIDRVRAKADQPGTKGSFTLQIKVGWDSEHEARLLAFRDGKLTSVDC